jgi:hypothetical protein
MLFFTGAGEASCFDEARADSLLATNDEDGAGLACRED